jgi:hypothetical protein
MALGALLALLPRVATFAHNRVLLLPTVGTAWMLAAYVTGGWKDQSASRLTLWFQRVIIVLILGAHGLLAPAEAVSETAGYAAAAEKELSAALRADMPGPAQAEDARVLLLSGPPSGINMAGLRWISGWPYPEAVWVVTVGKGGYHFNRTGPDSFSIQLLAGDFIGGIGARNCVEEFSFKAGQSFRRGALEVVIQEANEGKIQKAEFRIDRPLDNPEVWLLVWDSKRFVRRQLRAWPR